MFDSVRKALRKLKKKLRPRQRKVKLNRDEAIVFGIEGSFDYPKLAARCRTQNEFNRLHIGLENVCTPRELANITKLVFPATRSWLKHYHTWTPELFDAPQRYERREISPHMILYQSSEADARDKDLLVAFTDNARRLLMPICAFLQFLDSRMWDVVVLKKCSRDSYLLGLEGISTDFCGLVEFVHTTLSPMQYQRVITLGASAGGYAAILAALHLGAERGISISGSPPRTHLAAMVGDRQAAPGTDLCYVFGQDSATDRQSALVLSDLFGGGRLCPVPGVHGHNPLSYLLKNGQFAEFIDKILE
jgi:hypothetical protein